VVVLNHGCITVKQDQLFIARPWKSCAVVGSHARSLQEYVKLLGLSKMVSRVVRGKLTTLGSDLDSLTNLMLMDAYDFSLCSLDGKDKCSACFPHGNVPLIVDYAVQRAHPLWLPWHSLEL
jgi:hypothetical protein